jgi:hypothetical protein
MKPRLAAGRGHAVAGDARKMHIGQPLPKCRKNQASQQVTRGFAGGHRDTGGHRVCAGQLQRIEADAATLILNG